MTLNEFMEALAKEIAEASKELEGVEPKSWHGAYLEGGIAALENVQKVLKEKVL